MILLSACSSSKFIPDRQYLLDKVEIHSEEKNFDAAQLEPYIRQKANSKWFMFFKIPLGAYSLAGKDTSKWVNRTLQHIGEEPVIYDTLQARLSCNDLRTAMQNLGYMNASVQLNTKVRGKKLKAIYHLFPGDAFGIGKVVYDIQDDSIRSLMDKKYVRGLNPGMKFTVSALDDERKRIVTFLADEGYYRFHKDFIQYTAD